MSTDWWSLGTFVLFLAGVTKHGITYKEPPDPLTFPIDIVDGLLNHSLNSTTIFPKPSPLLLNPLHGGFNKDLDAKELFATTGEILCPDNKRFVVSDISLSVQIARSMPFIQTKMENGQKKTRLFPQVVTKKVRQERKTWEWDANIRECSVLDDHATGKANPESGVVTSVFRRSLSSTRGPTPEVDLEGPRFRTKSGAGLQWGEFWERFDAQRRLVEEALGNDDGRNFVGNRESKFLEILHLSSPHPHSQTSDTLHDGGEVKFPSSRFASSRAITKVESSLDDAPQDIMEVPLSYNSIFENSNESTPRIYKRNILDSLKQKLSDMVHQQSTIVSPPSESQLSMKDLSTDGNSIIYEYPVLKKIKQIDLKFKDGRMKIATGEDAAVARVVIVRKDEKAYLCGVVGLTKNSKGEETWEKCSIKKN